MSKDVNSTQVKLDTIFEESGSSAKQVTKGATEADLETRIDAAIRNAFKFLPHDAIRHQTTFSFQFGRKKITIGGKDKTYAQARADVILYFKETPLAVLELKKNGSELTEEDSQQGLSYARVLNPSPPLVVVSNGLDVRFIETYTGQDWNPIERSEQMLQGLFQSAAKVAAGDLKLAVSTLMATNPEVWIQAVRKTTEANIDELSGDWSDRLLPFVRGFEIPRKATMDVIELLRSGCNLVIVEGSPLVGKSNVLRELAKKAESESDLVVLFVKSEGFASVLQEISDTLARELNWPVTKEDARSWLIRLSQIDSPKLVIVIDGIGLNLSASCKEIVELTSQIFDKKLAIVIELDDTNADVAVFDSKGRQASAIGRRAKRVNVKPLSAEEFDAARKSLWNHRIEMAHGAQSSDELRLPWVLRAIGSYVVNQSKHRNLNFAAVIPPLLSVDLIHYTRDTFDTEIKISFQKIASAALKDAKDAKRPVSLLLESMSLYVIREKTLKNKLSESELAHLVEKGYLKKTRHESNEVVYVVRIPELVASEASGILAHQLGEKARKSAEDAAQWLSKIAASLPLGDVIAAQALIDATLLDKSISFEVIRALLNHPPQQEKAMVEGRQFAMHLPGSGTLFLTVCSDGFSAKTAQGAQHFIPFEPDDDLGLIYADFHPWLILSHLAGMPLAVTKIQDDFALYRVDPAILLQISKCPIILRRPSADFDMNSILTHEIEGHGSIVCHKSGIVEPITLSLLKFLGRETNNAREWIQEAVSSGSFPLLNRLDIALQELTEDVDNETSTFAKEALSQWVRPAFSNFPLIH